MTHSVPRTFSPSSLRITRSTPCVEGCCGPMLRTNSVVSRKVESGIPRSLAAFDSQVFLHPALVLLENSVVFTQRVALPLVGHQDAPHVGVPREFDAEHIVDFALQPVGGQVYAHRRLRLKPVRDKDLDAHPLVAREAIQDVDHIEALGALGPIHRRDVHQVVEIRLQLQVFQNGNRRTRLGHNKILAEIGGSCADAFAERLLEFPGEVALPRGGSHCGGGVPGGASAPRASEAPAWGPRRLVLPVVPRPRSRGEGPPLSPQAFARQPSLFLVKTPTLITCGDRVSNCATGARGRAFGPTSGDWPFDRSPMGQTLAFWRLSLGMRRGPQNRNTCTVCDPIPFVLSTEKTEPYTLYVSRRAKR